MSQAVDEAHKASPAKQRSPTSERKPVAKAQSEDEAPSPAVSDRGRVMTLAGNFERMSSQYNMHLPLSPMTSPTRSVVPSAAHVGPAQTAGKADKDKAASPSKSAPQAAHAAPVVRPAVDEDFDDFSIHSEGSDVFPATPDPPTQKASAARAEAPTKEDEIAVTAFSPGSVASPPPRAKLNINTATQAAPHQATVPDTPDSPWDDESEVDGAAGGAGESSFDVSKDEQQHGDDDADDTSSVDSDIRSQKKPSPKTSVIAGKLAPLSPTKSGAGSVPFQPMRGPSLSSVSQLAGPGSSPAKPLLSGSLLQKGRSSGPNLGSYK